MNRSCIALLAALATGAMGAPRTAAAIATPKSLAVSVPSLPTKSVKNPSSLAVASATTIAAAESLADPNLQNQQSPAQALQAQNLKPDAIATEVSPIKKAQSPAQREFEAESQNRNGLYGSVSGDIRYFNSIDVDPFDADIDFNTGYGLNAALGYKFNNFRVEGQFAYGKNDIDKVTFAGTEATTVPGTGLVTGSFTVPAVGIPLTTGAFTVPTVTTPLVTGAFTVPIAVTVPGTAIVLPAGTQIPAGIPLNPGTPPTTAAAVNVNGVTIPAGTPLPAGFPTTGGGTGGGITIPGVGVLPPGTQIPAGIPLNPGTPPTTAAPVDVGGLTIPAGTALPAEIPTTGGGTGGGITIPGTPIVLPPGTQIPAGIPLNPGNPPTTAAPVTVNGVTIPAGTPIPAQIPTTPGTAATTIPGTPATQVDADGSISTVSGLLNVYYDFPISAQFEPYVGAGIGVSNVSANDVSAILPGTNNRVNITGSATVLVYQLMAGIAYYINPKIALTLGYRYFNFTDNSLDFDVSGAGVSGKVSAEGGGINNIELGARFRF